MPRRRSAPATHARAAREEERFSRSGLHSYTTSWLHINRLVRKAQLDSCGLSAPAATEGTVELHDCSQFLLAEAGECQLSLEQVPLGVQHLQVTLETAAIAQGREAIGFAERFDQQLLLRSLLGGLTISDEGIRDFTERCLDGFLVIDEGLALERLSEANIGPDAAGIENRQYGAGRKIPVPSWAGEQVRERAALAAEESSEADLRKIL